MSIASEPSRRRRLWWALPAASLIAAALWWYWHTDVEVQHRTIQVGDSIREYRLVIPDSVRDKHDLPVVIALHGALDTTDEMAAYTGLDQLAAEHSFLLVYLQGRFLNWPPSIPEEKPDIAEPDLQLFDQVCDELIDTLGADRQRIYVVGVSQGGAMCNLLVTQRSERIAAAVCNCGWMPKPLDTQPLNTVHKSPMLFLVGSRDTQVPAKMVRVACDVFQRGQHPVRFQILEGAGHGWNQKFDVNNIVWEFLHDKRLGEQGSDVVN